MLERRGPRADAVARASALKRRAPGRHHWLLDVAVGGPLAARARVITVLDVRTSRFQATRPYARNVSLRARAGEELLALRARGNNSIVSAACLPSFAPRLALQHTLPSAAAGRSERFAEDRASRWAMVRKQAADTMRSVRARSARSSQASRRRRRGGLTPARARRETFRA
jgi:hypothetical protein